MSLSLLNFVYLNQTVVFIGALGKTHVFRDVGECRNEEMFVQPVVLTDGGDEFGGQAGFIVGVGKPGVVNDDGDPVVRLEAIQSIDPFAPVRAGDGEIAAAGNDRPFDSLAGKAT